MVKRSNKRSSSLLVQCWSVVAALVLQDLAITVMSDVSSFEDQKNFFLPSPIPDPNAGSPPIVSYTPPSHGSGGGGHSTPTPHHGTPPANCGNPPARSGSGSGSGSHHRNPSPGGSGGYYHSPPSKTPTTPITTPTPVITPPVIPTPSPPFSFDPNSPPFTCTYWRNHPTLIWGVLGWFGTVGSAFGVTSLPGFGSNTNLLQALSNTRTDGLGELYREGTAALLNSMADHTRYPYSTTQVRDSFVAALGSNHAASAQASLFKMANEGRIKPRT